MRCVRYAAKLAGLYPADPVLALRCDEVMDTCLDALGQCPHSPDPEIRNRNRTEYAAGKLRGYVTLLESKLTGKYVLGDALCVADLVLWYFVTKILRDGELRAPIPTTYCDEFAKLMTHEAVMACEPIVERWMAHRTGIAV